MRLSPEQRGTTLAVLLKRSGETCEAAARTFFQGLDAKGNAYWNIACKGGKTFSIRVNNDSVGSTNIVDCAMLKLLTVKCFVKF